MVGDRGRAPAGRYHDHDPLTPVPRGRHGPTEVAGLAERERAATPPYGGVFVVRSQVMTADDVRRAITRIAHEIVERNHGVAGVGLIGLQTGGVPLAHRLAEALQRIDGAMAAVPVGTIDVALYRDDIGLRPVMPEAVTDIPFDVNGMTLGPLAD